MAQNKYIKHKETYGNTAFFFKFSVPISRIKTHLYYWVGGTGPKQQVPVRLKLYFPVFLRTINLLAIQRIKLFETTKIYNSFYLIPESES